MRYVLNGPLKEYRNERRTDKTRTIIKERTGCRLKTSNVTEMGVNFQDTDSEI